MAPRLFFLALLVSAALAQYVLVVNSTTPLKRLPADRSYLSFNIDTASLYNNISIAEPKLRFLVEQLAPAVLRIGGTAADSAIYTGAGGARGGDGKGGSLIDNSYFDEILAFAKSTDTTLLWNLNCREHRVNGGYDPTWNATALFSYIQSKGASVGLWSCGNEPEAWKPYPGGTQLGKDIVTLAKSLQNYNVGRLVTGASWEQYNAADMRDFLVASRGYLSELTVHRYCLVHQTSCDVPSFLNHTLVEEVLLPTIQGARASLDQYGDPNTLLVLEETASAAGGGCPNISNRFASGFVHLHVLGLVASAGYDRIHRQDVVGWSFYNRASNYGLVGTPGWVSGAATLTPHPDWFLSVLFKQVVGTAVLSSVLSGGADTSTVAAHAFCASTRMAAGSVTIAWLNYGASDVSFSLNGVTGDGGTEYVVTSTAAAFTDFATRRAAGTLTVGAPRVHGAAPPDSLTADETYLNGVLMTVDANGLLPEYPLPGKAVSGNEITAPPYSFGFFTVNGGPFGACL